MTTRRKGITKPSFIITYAISFLIVSLVLMVVGILIYSNERSKYDGRVIPYAEGLSADVDDQLANFIIRLEENTVTGKELAELKAALIRYYSQTGVYYEVYSDKTLIMDSSRSVILNFCLPEDRNKESKKFYAFEIADDKYTEYFNKPEYFLNYDESYEGREEGFITHPFVCFWCYEFYIDYESFKFIPVRSSIITEGKCYDVKISPDPKEVEGFTYVKCSEDEADGYMGGHEGELSEIDRKELSIWGYNRNRTVYSSVQHVKSFNEKYGYYIKLFAVVLFVFSMLISLIPASVRYNINKRNYEIYEYRRQTTNAMAHDLKTPIASIIAYSELLENNVDAENRDLYLAKISETAAQMNSSVNNILQFSRSENSSVPLSKSEVKVEEIIHGIISDNEQKISDKGLKVDFDEKTAPTLNTDKELFRQALGNLINNAVLYSKDNTSVTIECNDEGIKITNVMAEPVEDINKIKEPFIKGSSSRENGGTGLGLAIAENDLAMLKYTLNVKTENELFVCTVDFK